MAGAEIALIVVAFGAMAVVFGAQARAEERRILAWAEETLARLAGAAGTVEPPHGGTTAAGATAAGTTAPGDAAPGDTAAAPPAPPPRELMDAA